MQLRPGQLALVTGAASGIGAALSAACIERGLQVVLADVEEEALRATAAELGPAALTLTLDVSDAAAVDAAARQLAEPVDLLVCNAGVVGPLRPLWQQTAADWQWVLGVNLYGTVNVLTAFLPAMVARDSGHVVLTSSTAGLAPVAGGNNAPYAASKHALLGVADTLREELAAHAPAVGVTTLCPGPVATRIRDAARNRPAHLADDSPAPAPTFTHQVPTISAEEVAEGVLQAVAAGSELVLPNPGSLAEARAHRERQLAAATSPDNPHHAAGSRSPHSVRGGKATQAKQL